MTVDLMPSTPSQTDASPIDLYDQPGHLIRRAHQIAVSVFHETLGSEVTPLQYSIMRALQESPGIDQVTLAQQVALDTSTAAEVSARLESKGWIVRELLPRRQRRLLLTARGSAVLAELAPRMHRMQQTLLGRLDAGEREEFVRLLRRFVRVNDEHRTTGAGPVGAADAPPEP